MLSQLPVLLCQAVVQVGTDVRSSRARAVTKPGPVWGQLGFGECDTVSVLTRGPLPDSQNDGLVGTFQFTWLAPLCYRGGIVSPERLENVLACFSSCQLLCI